MGEHVLIAWNCSTETARTVGFAMPLLTDGAADHRAHGPARHRARPECRRARAQPAAARTLGGVARGAAGDASTGEAILREAKACGADLIIKGAYTQSRLRQMIFGGATSHILAAAELPVVMAN